MAGSVPSMNRAQWSLATLRVVAFDVNSDEFFYTDTALNQTEFILTGIPSGTYQVVAYVLEGDNHLGGGYSNFVTCGLSQVSTT